MIYVFWLKTSRILYSIWLSFKINSKTQKETQMETKSVKVNTI